MGGLKSSPRIFSFSRSPCNLAVIHGIHHAADITTASATTSTAATGLYAIRRIAVTAKTGVGALDADRLATIRTEYGAVAALPLTVERPFA